MHYSTIAQLAALVSIASAAPQPIVTPLQFDDVIIIGDGTHQMIKHSEYENLVARGLLNPSKEPVHPTAPHEKRGCESSEEIQVLSDTSFLNWDVAMSPVVSSTGGAVSVGITAGTMIANSVAVTGGLTGTIETVLGISFSLTYTKTWTATETQSISYTLPENSYGLIVSQPMVRRVEGNYLSGCTEEPTSAQFISDTYTSQSYGTLDWVTGVVRLCNSTTYPVPYCIGEGTHS